MTQRPVIAVMNFDLMRALAGNPMVVADLDGNEVLLRLFTPQELLVAVEGAQRRLESQGLPPFEPMSYEQAVELSAPIEVAP